MMKKIDLQMLKRIRKITLAGFDMCKKALIASENNFEKALEWLDKQGIVKGSKRVDGKNNEGICQFIVAGDQAFLLELNCETDFVATNGKFKQFFQAISQLMIINKSRSLAEVNELILEETKVANALLKLSHQFGEKISFGNFYTLTKKPEEAFVYYNHNDFKNSALLLVDKKLPDEELDVLAMHVVAMRPHFINLDDIPASYVIKQKKLIKEMVNEKVPSSIGQVKKEKIIANRLEKKLQELCLVHQKFVKEPKITVGQYLTKKNLKIYKMIMLKVGERIYEC